MHHTAAGGRGGLAVSLLIILDTDPVDLGSNPTATKKKNKKKQAHPGPERTSTRDP
jgi:hypothetical protein